MASPWGSRPRRPPRNLLFDLGCTRWSDDRDPTGGERGSGRGPSLPLFTRMYEQRCITFDEVHGWESQPVPSHEWWRPVPRSMRSRLRFYNVGVDEGNMTDVLVRRRWAQPAPKSSRGRAPTSFLRTLREVARPADFVVVKLDIDGGPERQIATALAEIPELLELVDEFFFEWHYHFDGRDFGWGPLLWAKFELCDSLVKSWVASDS